MLILPHIIKPPLVAATATCSRPRNSIAARAGSAATGRGALACRGTATRSRAYGVVALRQSQGRWRRGVLNPTKGTGKQTQRRQPSLRQPEADGRISVREAHRVGTPHACAHPDLLLVRCSAGPARRRPLLERAADAGGGQLLAVQLRGAACPDALPLQPRLASPHGGRRPTPRRRAARAVQLCHMAETIAVVDPLVAGRRRVSAELRAVSPVICILPILLVQHVNHAREDRRLLRKQQQPFRRQSNAAGSTGEGDAPTSCGADSAFGCAAGSRCRSAFTALPWAR